MAEHIWSVLSTKTVVDSLTNNLSLFDILERVVLSGPGPAEYKKGSTVLIPFSFTLTTYWTRSDPKKPEMVKTRITLLAPDKKSVYSREVDINLVDHRNSRGIFNFNNFPLSGSGTYTYKIDMEKKRGKGSNWKNMASIPFEIIFNLKPSVSENSIVTVS